jgi:FG-GAP repeat protein
MTQPRSLGPLVLVWLVACSDEGVAADADESSSSNGAMPSSSATGVDSSSATESSTGADGSSGTDESTTAEDDASSEDTSRSVSGAGDVNADGFADVVVGAMGASGNGNASGRAYVVFGKADTDAVHLGDIRAGDGGFALEGEDEGDLAGVSVSDAGDVNGDGRADIVVGALFAGESSWGRVYVVFGRVDTDPVELADIVSGEGGFAIDGLPTGTFSATS